MDMPRSGLAKRETSVHTTIVGVRARPILRQWLQRAGLVGGMQGNAVELGESDPFDPRHSTTLHSARPPETEPFGYSCGHHRMF